MRAYTGKLRERAGAARIWTSCCPEAYALVREAAVRALGQRPFDTQMIGAIVLHQGRIAEMRTGEGKTLTAALPAFLNALPGEGVHIVTVNEYLARFHSEWMGKVYRFLGLTVGLIEHDMDAPARQAAYACDITYGTNNEFGFDYLRDNMVTYKERMVQRPLNFANRRRGGLHPHRRGAHAADHLRPRRQAHGDVCPRQPVRPAPARGRGKRLRARGEGKDHCAHRGGRAQGRDLLRRGKPHRPGDQELYHYILAALRANVLMKRDVDYVVKDGQVIIVDEFTGV